VNGPGTSTNVFLRGDGTWQTPTNTTYKQLNTANHSAAEGHVIKGPGTTYSDYATLLPNGSWGELYLLFGSDGVDINKRYVIRGLEDSESPMDQGELERYYLCANGNWEIPAGGGGGGTTYATLSASAHASNASYVIKGIGSSTNDSSYLRSDGSWHTPTNTTYGTFTTAANGLVPKPTAAHANTNYVLAGNGTWVGMSGGGSVEQARGLYGSNGAGPMKGASMPTTEGKVSFPNINASDYPGARSISSLLLPTDVDNLSALPVEISQDGVIYIPVSQEFFATLIGKGGYTARTIEKPK
jgi:hypothetical protein